MSRVLVADDDQSVRESLCDILTSGGFEATGAADGDQALRLLRQGDDFDCLILDMHMPRVDGGTVLATINDDARPTVIVVSAFEYVEQRTMTERYGERVCTFLKKPVAPRTFLRAVADCLADG